MSEAVRGTTAELDKLVAATGDKGSQWKEMLWESPRALQPSHAVAWTV